MDKEVNGHLYIANDNLKRIADALEEILRLVKKDHDESKKRWEEDNLTSASASFKTKIND